MSKDTAESKRLKQLRELVTYHHNLYHRDDAPEITDQAYDALYHELKALEEKWGEKATVAAAVGATPSQAFTKVRHEVPQWSFDNVFTRAELTEWHDRLVRQLKKSGLTSPLVSYVCEHKIDGLKAVIEYRSGNLFRVLTRGDGEFGEDVTHTAETIASLPQKLTTPVDLICVGEVWLARSDFETLNETRKKAGEPLFANPRNAAAGSLRQLDPEVARARKLSLFVYDIDKLTIPSGVSLASPQTQFAELQVLKQLGLPTNQYSQECADIEAIQKYYELWKGKHDSLPYGVDGIVIKLSEISQQLTAGYTAKAPRFGVAYKFPAVETTTVIEGIELQVGRTGVVTPVAHLRPVLIDGSTVARATLHNEDQIKRLDIRVGDTVILRKAGDVIPEVVAVLTELRPTKSVPYVFPKTVALCGGDGRIERRPGEVAYRCISLDSDFLHRQQLYYFVGKTALNIDGIGPKIVDALLDAQLITDAADLYKLTQSDFLTLPGFKEKSAQNAYLAIQKAKAVTFSRLLVGLSIENVGEETARLLVSYFPTPEDMLKADYESLAAIHGIGEVVAKAVTLWQKSKEEQSLFKRLCAHLTFIPELTVVSTGAFSGQTLLFTGTLKTLTRSEAEARATQAGAKIVGAVSKSTSYLVVGEDPGSKVAQAKKYGVTILTEAEFLARMAE